LAEIETPEVDQQLEQARSELETAKANLNLAMTTADRWKKLLEEDSVSKQETDQAVSNLQAQKATVDSNAANVRRLEELRSFERVYAPFDGIITARNTDVGALINAGAATTPGRELFHLAAIHTLRVYVSVPEVYLRAAIPGAIATLTLDEFPGQVFRGTLARNANAIDPISRTLLVEVDVGNPSGQLLPGAYMSIHLKLPEQIRSVTIPANTLLFRAEGLRVGVVKNNHVALIPAKIGRDYGDTVEVLSGLQPADAIIVDPSDSLISGAEVQVRER
jgi:RND family efflux transporter MFP subunit